jgi:hypothetical protein
LIFPNAPHPAKLMPASGFGATSQRRADFRSAFSAFEFVQSCPRFLFRGLCAPLRLALNESVSMGAGGQLKPTDGRTARNAGPVAHCGMVSEVMTGRAAEAVRQFSVFTPNRLGRLHELVNRLGSHNVHVLAMTVLDTTDSAIIRLVLDDPDRGRGLLRQNNFPFAESAVLAVEIISSDDLNRLMAALLEAELNINYLYSFIPHPHGKSIVAVNLEDNELAEAVLKRHQFAVLKQSDLAR